MRLLLVIIFITAADQIVKYFISANMVVGQSIPVLNDIFHITYVHNKGAAFGILAEKLYIFIIITIVILMFIFLVFLKTRKIKSFFVFHLALAVLAGGALGNLIDRIAKGYVIDYLDFIIWPVFNVADIAVVLGVFIMVYYVVKSPKSIL